MNILVVGASRGLGDAFVNGLNASGIHFYLLSRTEPPAERDNTISATWIKADLSKPEYIDILKDAIKNTPIDVLIYNAGIWEKDGFSDSYDFVKSSAEEIKDIITVNLTSAILCVQSLMPNLKKAGEAKIILIGSTSGLDNNQTKEAAYQASKFGLRGFNNALRENLRGTRINSTILNLGNLSTQIPFKEGKEAVIKKLGHSAIPLHDVISVTKCILSLSPATLIKEIDVACLEDESL